jgi:hypothetical protein
MSFATSPEPNKEQITYIRQISPDNYKKQGIEFTKKALRELKEQMTNFKAKKHSVFEKETETETDKDTEMETNELDNTDDCVNNNSNETDSDSDYDVTNKRDSNSNSNTNINLIIKNVKKDKKTPGKSTPSKLTPSKSTPSKLTPSKLTPSKSMDIENAMLKQFEKDNKKVLELKSICKKMDKDLHYLKLDLINSQCDKDILEKEVKFYKNKIEYIDKIIKFDNEKYIKEKKYLKYFKIFIILLLALNLYLYYFKYFMFIIGMCFLYFTK